MLQRTLSLDLNQSSQAVSELRDEEQFAHEQSYCSSSDLSRENDLASLVVETGSDLLLMSDVQSGPYNTPLYPADEDCSTGKLGPAKPVHMIDAHVQSGHETDTQGYSSADTGNVVETRAGRVSKKVNRLIESMAQRPIIARDLAS